jgi:hypothetical protein
VEKNKRRRNEDENANEKNGMNHEIPGDMKHRSK